MSDPNRSKESDPREMLRALVERGDGNTADAIMLRLLWLRQEHPQAAVTTTALHIEADRVVMHAAISLREGAAGSGIAAARIEDEGDWADVVERTETIAISRALDTLGYVLRAATVEQPASPAPEPIREIRRQEPVEPQVVAPPTPMREPSVPPVQRPAPPRMDESAPSVVNALRRANRPPEPRPVSPEPRSISGEDDVHLEEYSWNTFWSRARELGLTPDKVKEALGRPANQMSPREAVAGLIEAGAWPQPDDE